MRVGVVYSFITMTLTQLIYEEYKDISGTVVDKLVSPKRDVKLEYELMPGMGTYAKGVHALQNSYLGKEAEVPSKLWYENNGQKIVRPLTFRENLQARVDDFETLKNKDGSKRSMDERLRFFNTGLDSCTGIAYFSKKKDDFMIIPVCKELITIPRDFDDKYIPINYTSLQGKGFSLKRSQAKYDQLLTESEVISHPAWITSVEEDIPLICAYTSILFNHILQGDKAMGFFLRNQIEKDQLRGLFVSSRNYSSDAYGDDYLSSGSVFLRATSLS